MKTEQELIKKLLRRKLHLEKRASKQELRIEGMSPEDLNKSFNYFGGWTVGYAEGRLDGFLTALDILEEQGLEGLYDEH